MSDLAKREELSIAVKNMLQKHKLNIQVGDLIIRPDDGSIYRIREIDEEHIHIQHKWNDKWSNYGSIRYEEYVSRKYVKLDRPIEQIELETMENMKDLDKLFDSQEEKTESTSLACAGNKEYYEQCESDLMARKDKFALMQAAMNRKINALDQFMRGLEKQLGYVRKVLGVVELYLGVHEEIVQIKEGQPALVGEPIHVRQQLLYMDEELGDPKDGGIDFQNLEDFDKWLLDPDHLNQVLPEHKGIVAIRVRRNSKPYLGYNPFRAAAMNLENFETYLLIRNGDNLYRIWSNVKVHPRLFPSKKDFEFPRMRSSSNGGKLEPDPFWDEDKQEEREFQFKTYGLMIQGIIHRTPIFQPITTEIDVFKPSTWNGMFVLIRDDEMQLPSGRLSWNEWQQKINAKIEVGSRIVYTLEPGWRREYMDYHVSYHCRHLSPPATGVYTVVPGINNEHDLRILYMPSDEVYTDWYYGCNDYGYHERKQRVGFGFSKTDSNVLNYDQISLQDIEFYLSNRTDRHNYVEMIPLLWMLRKQRLEELEREKCFVKLVVQRNGVSEKRVWKLIEWWKYKNKWHRPVSEDDAKALRMIERKIRRDNDKSNSN